MNTWLKHLAHKLSGELNRESAIPCTFHIAQHSVLKKQQQ